MKTICVYKKMKYGSVNIFIYILTFNHKHRYNSMKLCFELVLFLNMALTQIVKDDHNKKWMYLHDGRVLFGRVKGIQGLCGGWVAVTETE